MYIATASLPSYARSVKINHACMSAYKLHLVRYSTINISCSRRDICILYKL